MSARSKNKGDAAPAMKIEEVNGINSPVQFEHSPVWRRTAEPDPVERHSCRKSHFDPGDGGRWRLITQRKRPHPGEEISVPEVSPTTPVSYAHAEAQ